MVFIVLVGDFLLDVCLENAQIKLIYAFKSGAGDSTVFIPFLLEAAGGLATFVHPNHIVYLCSWGLTHLPPTCNSKLFGYIRVYFIFALWVW
ncbi:hypothetical protein FLL70_14215 [Vibrio cholerae]|nr:hypothetical protein FLL70_14215 [Vibrio cholerae]